MDSGAGAEDVGETSGAEVGGSVVVGADDEDSPDPSGTSPDPVTSGDSEGFGDSEDVTGAGVGDVGFPSTSEVSPFSPPSISIFGRFVLFVLEMSRVVAAGILIYWLIDYSETH